MIGVRLVLLLALAFGAQGQCSRGCIACEKLSPLAFSCSVCDLYNHYALDDQGVCSRQVIPDCELPSADRTKSLCLQCSAGFVLDKEELKCVLVPEQNRVSQCLRYMALNHCSRCLTGHSLREGLCVAVQNLISGCDNYVSDGSSCNECLAGFELRAGQCVSFTQIENCLSYSTSVCDTCKTGFFKERNYFSTLRLDSQTVENLVLENRNQAGTVRPPVPTVCHKNEIPNCVNYLNYLECEKCEDNHYVNQERKCSRNPYNRIPYCARYKDKLTCRECEQTHFLGANECFPRTTVPNCKTYNIHSSVCVECEGPYYVEGNVCRPRVFSKRIQFCVERDGTKDECLKCKDRFLLTADKRACLLEISNCQTYNPASSHSISNFVCNVCRAGYYPSNNSSECLKQDVINCKQYQANSPKCLQCDPGFFYKQSENKCQNYTASGCLTRKADEDRCDTCLVGHYKTSNNECFPYTISNCETEEPDSDACKVCEANHFKSSGNCFKYNLIGCGSPEADKNECQTCLSGYYKMNGICLKNNLSGCKVASDVANECQACEAGHYLKDKKCLRHSVPNCLLFQPDDNKCYSTGCESGYYHQNGYCFKVYVPNCDTPSLTANSCQASGCKEGFYFDSGACKIRNKPFCREYSSGNECSACMNGYYLRSGRCYEQYVEGCLEYPLGNSINCSKCAAGFYLKDNTCRPYTISNCLAPKENQDACTQCRSGFFKDQTTGNCYLFDIPYCKTPNPTASPPACDTCHKGYMLAAGKCYLGTSIENCAEIASSSTLTCQLCRDGYYPNSSQCKLQAPLHSGNCMVFKANSQDCAECKSGFYGTSCTAVSNMTNCQFSNGVDNACSICKRGFKNTANCVAVASLTPLDVNCLGNSTTNDATCSKCKAGYSIVPNVTTVYQPFDNCEQPAASNNGCNLCAFGYRLNSNGTCSSSGTTGKPCGQKIAGNTTDLNIATGCHKCSDNTKYWNDSNECKQRSILFDNCVAYTANMDTLADTLCERCAENTAMPKTLNYGFCLKGYNPSNPPGRKTITDCEVIDLPKAISEDSYCLTCKQGKNLGSANATCEAPTVGHTVYNDGVTNQLTFQTIVTNLGMVPNGINPGLVGPSLIQWTACEAGFVKSLGSATLPNSTGDYDITISRTFIEGSTGRRMPFAYGSAVSSCIAISNSIDIGKIKNPNNNNEFITSYDFNLLNNCESIIFLAGYDAICIKCKGGFDGQRYKTSQSKAGVNVTGSAVTGLICEKRNTDFVKLYQGISTNEPNHTKILLEDQLQYDSCLDGRTLVVFMEVSQSQFVWSNSFLIGTQKGPSMRCVDEVPSSRKIPFCHAYAIKGDQDPRTSVDASYICITCVPGYKATTSGLEITACNPIPNCDTRDPSKNTCLSGCQTCAEGSVWTADPMTFVPNYNDCAVPADPNCWLVKNESGFGKCLICKRGFNVSTDYKCISTEVSGSNCARFGREATSYSLNLADTTPSAIVAIPISFLHVAAILTMRFEGYQTNAVGCAECNTDYSSFSTSGTIGNVQSCVAGFELFLPPIAECKHYQGKYGVTAALCAECNLGYALKIDNSSCEQNSVFLGECKELNNTLECIACHEGHQIHDTSGTPFCRPKGDCLDFDTPGAGMTRCKVCKEGFRPKSATSSECELIPYTDDCRQYLDFNKCLKCKSGGNPVHFSRVDFSIFVGCTSIPHASVPYSSMAFAFNGTALQVFNTSSSYFKIFSVQAAQDKVWNASNPAEICLPNVMVANCLRMGSVGCEQCEQGFALENPFRCAVGNVENCLTYVRNGVCSHCKKGFSAKSDGTCETRKLMNCFKADRNSQQCLVCDKGYYLDSTADSKCVLRTNLTCENFSKETDECLKCISDYYLDSSTGRCVKRDHLGCLFGNLNTNDCRLCQEGFYLSGGSCMRYSFGNCKLPSPVEDKCFVCQKDYFPDSDQKCQLRTNPNCGVEDFSKDRCISCQEGFYSMNDGCHQYGVSGCQVFHPYADQCLACVQGLYFQQASGKCVVNPDPNCEDMNPYLNGCVRCVETAYLDTATGVCKGYSVSCDYYNPFGDSCLECPSSQYLENGQCKGFTVKNCLVKKRFEDKCASCIPGFYFSEQGVCSPITVQNCDVPSLRSNQCLKCSGGYYNDKGVCRAYLVRNCKRLSPTENKCVTCSEGFYSKLHGTCAVYTQQGCLGFIPNRDRCASCKGGFYMKNGSCVSYTVANCRLHDPFADACLSCQTGFFINGAKCSGFTVKNCSKWSSNSDRCLACNQGHYLEGYDCKAYTISNCDESHPRADMCVKCSGKLYFRNGLGLCQMATPVSNCAEYSDYFNECTGCEKGFFLESKACVVNPQGVFRCQEYLDERNCLGCQAPYYLRDNQCLLSDTLVERCTLYTHNGICGQCNSGSILVGNVCKQYTNTTCAQWSSPENCLSCASGRVLDTSKSDITCEAIGIPDCVTAQFRADGNHQCIKCSPGFFLLANSCTATSSVANCLDYQSQELCSNCSPGFILSTDQRTCGDIESSAGTNCSTGRFTLQPQCSVCQQGFYFNSNGNCVPCQLVGCDVCDVVDLRQCKLCKSGFQMTELLYCETITAVEAGSLGGQNFQLASTSNFTESNLPGSVSRRSVSLLILSVLTALLSLA